jgi:hypothetical protein
MRVTGEADRRGDEVLELVPNQKLRDTAVFNDPDLP